MMLYCVTVKVFLVPEIFEAVNQKKIFPALPILLYFSIYLFSANKAIGQFEKYMKVIG